MLNGPNALTTFIPLRKHTHPSKYYGPGNGVNIHRNYYMFALRNEELRVPRTPCAHADAISRGFQGPEPHLLVPGHSPVHRGVDHPVEAHGQGVDILHLSGLTLTGQALQLLILIFQISMCQALS